MKESRKRYLQLVRFLDDECARLTARYRRHLVCRAGCSQCCGHDLSLFDVEAAQVGEAIRRLPGSVRERLERQARDCHGRGSCPLLLDDLCAIYARRPVICRTQGLPILFEAEDGEQALDFCPLNFTEPAAAESIDGRHVLMLEAINLRLAVVNLLCGREGGRSPEESGRRRRMSEIVLEG